MVLILSCNTCRLFFVSFVLCSVSCKPGFPFSVLLLSSDINGTSVDGSFSVTISKSVAKSTYLVDQAISYTSDTSTALTTNGQKMITIDVPVGLISLTISVNTIQSTTSSSSSSSMPYPINNYASAYLSVNPIYSPTGSYLNIHSNDLSTTDKLSGSTISFEIGAILPVNEFDSQSSNIDLSVIITARGKLIQRSTIQAAVIKTEDDKYFFATPFPLTITTLMSPSATLLIHYRLPKSNELISDYLPFKVEAATDNLISLSFSQEEVSPGSQVDLNIKTADKSSVAIVAVDHSIQILNGQKKINLNDGKRTMKG